MGPLPGTNIIMDDTALGMNGHPAIDGLGPVIEHDGTPALTEPTPSEAQEPEPI
jgi:hypothetical protein